MLTGILWDLPLAVQRFLELVFAVADILCISPCSVLQPYAAAASGPPPLFAALLQQQHLQFLLLLWSGMKKIHHSRTAQNYYYFIETMIGHINLIFCCDFKAYKI